VLDPAEEGIEIIVNGGIQVTRFIDERAQFTEI
jgi:hypothetical protein